MTMENWEDTLNQVYNNYKKQCKKIHREKTKLKHMEITIRTFELRYNDEAEKWGRRKST